MSAYITPPPIRIDAAHVRTVDRPDLGEALAYLNDDGDDVHVGDSATGRALAIAFAEAAQMREAAERSEQRAKDMMREAAEQAAKDPVPPPGPTAPDAEDHTGHSASGSSEIETDQRLLALLEDAGAEWGPLGVALAAARLTDRSALLLRLAEVFPAEVQPLEVSPPDHEPTEQAAKDIHPGNDAP